jgi:hypothetical protein
MITAADLGNCSHTSIELFYTTPPQISGHCIRVELKTSEHKLCDL